MKIFFSDFSSTPQQHTAKELAKYECVGENCANSSDPPEQPNPEPKTKKIVWAIFVEQLINSLIVGGIAGLSCLAVGSGASVKAALIAAGITALVELRKYRKL